jgi:hypothetical protein
MPAIPTTADFRTYAGVGTGTSDRLVQDALDEALTSLGADVGKPYEDLFSSPAAAIARGEALRRANRLLARKNSPEAVAGAGADGIIAIPSRDPDSQRAVDSIIRLLGIDWPVA